MALSKPLVAVIGEEVECGICLERLKSPRVLGCLHSFCEECLHGYVNDRSDKSLVCPACRDVTAIPSSGISGLRPDFRANKLLKALEEEEQRQSMCTSTEHNCSLCGSPRALVFCTECDMIMCKICSDFHMKIPPCRNHETNFLNVELLSGILIVGDATSASKCPKHGEQFQCYCQTCGVPICTDCTVLEHRRVDGHDCVYLQDIMPQLRLELETLFTGVKNRNLTLEAFSKVIEQRKQTFQLLYDSIDQQIVSALADIQECILEKPVSFRS